MIDIYHIHCGKCRWKTPHKIFLIVRNRGVKLSCVVCGSQTQFLNASRLEKLRKEVNHARH